jgi:DNA mismatch endonuclease (patch repair protein)
VTDFMSREARSRVMSSIRSRNTQIELELGTLLRREGLRFRRHVVDLPGRPDFVFPEAHVAVFVDGDFWHGWRFPSWRHKLHKTYWREKIEGNIRRDRRHHRALRKAGWVVIRIWEHQMKRDPQYFAMHVVSMIRRRSGKRVLRPTRKSNPP